jgi:hypothetical protein
MTERDDYPSHYKPGAHWATDAAWEIMDTIKPGAIDSDIRSYLAGMIAGTLMKKRVDNKRLRHALLVMIGEEGEGLSYSERCEIVRAALEPKP